MYTTTNNIKLFINDLRVLLYAQGYIDFGFVIPTVLQRNRLNITAILLGRV